MRYVTIPNNLDHLFHCNYGNLEDSVKQGLSQWKILPLTLLEKIAIIKMNIPPRFLFLFQNLSLYITPTCFKLWEGLFRKFIWDVKKPRVKLKSLQQQQKKTEGHLPYQI